MVSAAHVVTFHLCIQGPFELQHVGILFWVHVIIGEDHRQTIHRQPEIEIERESLEQDLCKKADLIFAHAQEIREVGLISK